MNRFRTVFDHTSKIGFITFVCKTICIIFTELRIRPKISLCNSTTARLLPKLWGNLPEAMNALTRQQ